MLLPIILASFRFEDEGEDEDENEDQVQLLLIVRMLKSVTVLLQSTSSSRPSWRRKFEDFVVAKTDCLVFVLVPESKALYDWQRQPRPDLFPFPISRYRNNKIIIIIIIIIHNFKGSISHLMITLGVSFTKM